MATFQYPDNREFTVCTFSSNKDSDPEKYALKLKVHNDGVSSCRFSGDGEKVLSCAGTEVKVCEL